MSEEKELNTELVEEPSQDLTEATPSVLVTRKTGETEVYDKKLTDLIVTAEAQSIDDYHQAKEICSDFQTLMQDGDTAGVTKQAVNQAMDNITKATNNLINLANILARVKLGDTKIQIANVQTNGRSNPVDDKKQLITEIEAIMDRKGEKK